MRAMPRGQVMLDRRASLQAGDGDGDGGLILSNRGGISCIAQTQATGLEWCSCLGSFMHFSLLIEGLRVSDDGGVVLFAVLLFLSLFNNYFPPNSNLKLPC